jgi:hypothetical protein
LRIASRTCMLLLVSSAMLCKCPIARHCSAASAWSTVASLHSKAPLTFAHTPASVEPSTRSLPPAAPLSTSQNKFSMNMVFNRCYGLDLALDHHKAQVWCKQVNASFQRIPRAVCQNVRVIQLQTLALVFCNCPRRTTAPCGLKSIQVSGKALFWLCSGECATCISSPSRLHVKQPPDQSMGLSTCCQQGCHVTQHECVTSPTVATGLGTRTLESGGAANRGTHAGAYSTAGTLCRYSASSVGGGGGHCLALGSRLVC